MKHSKEIEFTTKDFYIIEAKPLDEFVDVSHFTNGNDFQLLRYEHQCTVTGGYSKQKTTKNERVTTKEFIDELVKTPDRFDDISKKNFTENHVCLMQKDFKTYFSQYGTRENLMGDADRKNLYRPYSSFVSDDLFGLAKHDDYEFMQFVANTQHLRVWKDCKGVHYMEPMVLDYVKANLENEKYHLDALIEHLMKRDDVAFITNAENRHKEQKILRCPIDESVKGVNGIIDDIPGYNATEDSTESVSIIYYPKNDDIPDLLDWNEQTMFNGKSCRDQKIWNLENYIVQVVLKCSEYLKEPVMAENEAAPGRRFRNSGC